MKRWIIPVTTVSSIIGLLLSMQYRTQTDAHKFGPSRRVDDLVVLLKSMETANKQLSEQVIQLQGRLVKSRPPADPSHDTVVAAYPAVNGPGLLVTVVETAAENKLENGTSAVVHAEDLLKIVNELRSGGAEAIALNGRRLVEMSEIVTAGQHIMVNKAPVVAPYRLEAIGPANEMKNALSLRGGVVEYLQFYGIEVKTEVASELELPAAAETGGFKFAKPAPVEQARVDS